VANVDINSKLFKGLQKRVEVARYHSLAASDENFPEVLQVIAKTDDNEIMAVKHKDYEIYGVQFHPESILTPKGTIILRNFLDS
jgi:anthranilate synthase component 2